MLRTWYVRNEGYAYECVSKAVEDPDEISGYVGWFDYLYHYENTPIQIYWKFHHHKPKVFR